MANIHDLKTEAISIAVGASMSTNIGGNIPTGKSRFLTFLRVERTSAILRTTALSGSTFNVGSHANSAADAGDISTIRAFGLRLHYTEINTQACQAMYPAKAFVNQSGNRPNINHPLCVVAGGASSYMMLARDISGPQVLVFAQYYDAP